MKEELKETFPILIFAGTGLIMFLAVIVLIGIAMLKECQ